MTPDSQSPTEPDDLLPTKADVGRCQEAADLFTEKVCEGYTTAAERYRNMAFAMGLVRDAVARYKVAAREARLEEAAS